MRLVVLAWGLMLGAALALSTPAAAAEPERPNFVLIFFDDMGYGDPGCFGGQGYRTPHIDSLARDGSKFTSFYVAQPVCTASRAALMTGCYANRVSLYGALNPTSTTGIHPDETLLPEVLKSAGYATAMFGKWHLGHQPMFSPLRNGFDAFFGIPFSNDNSNQYHPVVRDFPPLPLIDGEKVVAEDPDQSQFTRQITERSTAFIDQHKDRPFFLYVPHVMPHVPIFASEKFRGRTSKGLYGDVLEELDWSVGQILEALARHGLTEKTLVLMASDNGPFLSYGEHAGSAGPLREGKLTTWEGGVRTPCLARWPGKIPAGAVCDEPICAIDVLPTFAALAGGQLGERKIDGHDIGPLLRGVPGARSPHEALFFYGGPELQAVRSGRWKLHFPHRYLTVDGEPGKGGKPAAFDRLKPASIQLSGLDGIASRHGYRIEQTPLALFDLEADPGERTNVASQHPEIVERLAALADKMRSDLGDGLTKRVGAGVRPAGESK